MKKPCSIHISQNDSVFFLKGTVTLLELIKELKNRMILAKKALAGELQVSTPRKEFDINEISNRDKKIRELLEKKPEAIDKLICPTCGSECEGIYRCLKCGKEICDECGTFCAAPDTLSSDATVKSGYYCSDCW